MSAEKLKEIMNDMYMSLRTVFVDEADQAQTFTGADVEKIVRRELKKVHATHAEAAPAQEASDQPLRM